MGEQDQQTRQRLLRCAKAEFLSRGFEHASLRRICEAAGVTTGAVYFFFQNKEDLLDVYKRQGDILCKQLVRANYFSVLHKSAGSSRPEHDPIIIFLMVIK